MDLYIPRKCSATNRLITSKDHASVQINVGHLGPDGVYTNQSTTFALCGFIRAQLRRGADRADIYILAFSSTSQWLAVSSDKGTVHAFGLKDDSGTRSSRKDHPAHLNVLIPFFHDFFLCFMKGVLPKYFSSEQSVAQFRLHRGLQYIIAFGHQKNTVLILDMDGSFYRCRFDLIKGGEMNQLEHYNFLKPDEASQGEGYQL